MNLLLVGLRGCGKSTVARRLSAILDWECVDLDEIVLAGFAEGSINEVWQVQGEAAWREAEVSACRGQLGIEGERIISLGGGVPIIPEAFEIIKAAQGQKRAKVIYLHCETRELRRRLYGVGDLCRDRPPLLGDDSLKEIVLVAQEREPIYRQLADVVVDVSLIGIEETANRIAQNYLKEN